MKKLCSVIFLFLSLNSFAENWIAENKITDANNQVANVPGYTTEALCLADNPGQTCYEFTGQNLRYRKIVGGVWVDDAALKAAYDAEVAELAAGYTPAHAFARIAGGNGTQDCDTSPCVMSKTHPYPSPIDYVTRVATGEYDVFFKAGYWATEPVCVVSNDKGTADSCVLLGLPTTVKAQIKCFSSVGVDTDTRISITCGGKK